MIALETPALHDSFLRLAPLVYHTNILNNYRGSNRKVGEQPWQTAGKDDTRHSTICLFGPFRHSSANHWFPLSPPLFCLLLWETKVWVLGLRCKPWNVEKYAAFGLRMPVVLHLECVEFMKWMYLLLTWLRRKGVWHYNTCQRKLQVQVIIGVGGIKEKQLYTFSV